MNGEEDVFLEKERRLRRRKGAQKDKEHGGIRRRDGWGSEARRRGRPGNLANRPELWGAMEDE